MNPSMKSDAISKAATVEPATFESKLKADAQRSNDTALEHTSELRESERPKAARPLSYTNITLAYEHVPENPWAEHSNTDDRRRSEERGKGVAGRWEQAISESYDRPYQSTNGDYHDPQHIQSERTNPSNTYLRGSSQQDSWDKWRPQPNTEAQEMAEQSAQSPLDAYNAYTAVQTPYESDHLRTFNSHTSEATPRGVPAGAGLGLYEPHNADAPPKMPTLHPFHTYDSGISTSDDAGSTNDPSPSQEMDRIEGDTFSDFADSDGTASLYSSLRSYATGYY